MRWINRRITAAASLGAALLGAWMMSSVPVTVGQTGVTQAEWGRLPLRFEANLGQTDPRVRFLSRGPGYTLFVTDEETVLSIGHRSAESAGTPPVRMGFAGARPNPRITPGRQLPGRSHYFAGGDRSRWRTGVPAYERITLEQIYDGVDLVFHGSQQQLEYDFVVAPGADPRQIVLKIDGATGIRLDEAGNLVLRAGEVDLVQHRPVVYQDGEGARDLVDGAYVLGEDGEVRFAVGPYDSTRPLVIDPVITLAFSSFLGGSSTEISLNGGIAVDRDGNVYVAGDTSSTNFPLVNAIQTDRPSLDIFVTKIAADGSQIVYSTYIGGNAQEEAHDIAVNENGELWVAGFTDSVDNPATPAVNEGFPTFNAFQPAFGGGIGDAIVLKLSAAGDALVFSSHLGGGFCPGCVINRTYERAHAMTLDSAGNAYLTGFTSSPTGFATAGAFQTVIGGGSDGWVAKITAAGAKERLTYLGGRSSTDAGYGIAVDRDGFIYVTGSTMSIDNPATPAINEGFPVLNAFQPTSGSGNGVFDAFVTKLTPDLSALVYSSYLGGSSHENGTLLFNGRAGGIAVDSEGQAWVTGHTTSLNFPQVNPVRARSTGSELFITKVAPDGRSLVFSTYYGSPFNDFAQDLTIDSRDNVYIAAQAAPNFPVVNGLTATPAANINIGTGNDAVAMKLSPSGAVSWATYIGGFGNDFAMSIAADDAGDAYVMGSTNSPNFPLRSPFQATCPNCGTMFNSTDAFVAKLMVPNAPPVSIADGYSVPEDGALNIAAPGVLGNDTDADGNPLTAVLVSGPAAGALALNANGSFDYTPSPNFNGPVTFTYRADDGRVLGAAALVTIVVMPVNDPPSADGASLTVEHETPTAILLMAGDPDGDPLTFTITDAPDNGVLTGVAPDVTYTSNGGFAGADQFTFRVSDGNVVASATVMLTVTGPTVSPGYTMRTHARDVSTLGGGEAIAANLTTGNLYVRSRAVPNGAPAQFAEVPPDGSRTILATLPQMQNSPGTGIALDPLMPGGIIAANENFRINPRISRVDIASGAETTILPSPWVLNPLGNGRGAQQYATDPANPQLLYFWDATKSKLFRLNRTTGALDELLALDQGAPEGDHVTTSNDIAFDPLSGMILLSDALSRSILEIDPRLTPVTVRTIYSDLPTAPTALALDVPTRRLFVYLGAVFAGPRAGGTLSLVASGIGLFDMTIGRASSGTGRSLYAMDFFRDRIYEIRSLNSAPVAVDDTAATGEDVALDLTPLANDTDANGDALSMSIVVGPANGTLELLAGGIVRYTPAANWSGTDTFSYRASDGELESGDASVTITVTPLNDLPTADGGGPYTVPEGGSVGLVGTGSDVESATVTFDWDLDTDGVFETSGATPTFSAATIGGPSSRTVALRVTDSDGGSTIDTAIVTIENVAPAAAPDAYSVNEDETLAVAAVGVLANDVDFDTLTATLESGPASGQLTLNTDGSFSYVPNANFNGTDTFVYRANDGDADSAPTTVTLTVVSVNDLPSAEAGDTYTVPEGGSVLLAGSGSDLETASPVIEWDLDGDGVFETAGATPTFSAAAIGGPSSRTVALRVTDGDGGTAIDSAIVTIENVAPVAAPDTYSVDEDATLVVPAAGVLTNDVDFDPLTVALDSGPASGQLTLNSDGSFSYAPNANFNGTDTFVYRANDGVADSALTTVTLTVVSVNDLPSAEAGGPYTVPEGGSLMLAGSGMDFETASPVIEWDLDGDGVFETAGPTPTFSAAAIGGPATRVVSVRVTDGDGGTATDSASITIENVAPAAQPDVYSVNEDETLVVPAAGVLANDVDFDPLTVSLETGPANGQLTLNSDGSFSYAPNANFNGTDAFAYRANDGVAESGPVTVTLTINPINDPPLAMPQSVAGSEGSPVGITLAGTDIDGDALAFAIQTPPVNGTLSGTPPALLYTPNAGFNGADSFTFTVSDGGAVSAAATVALAIADVNFPPDANDDAATVAQVGGPWTIRVLANDTSAPDVGETLTVVGVTQPANGVASVSPDGRAVIYANNRRFAGTDTFTYTVGDGNGGTDTATAFVTVERGRGKSAQADLELTMSDSPDPVKVTGQLTYTLRVRNNGPSAASEVMLTDALPASLVFTSASATQGTCAAGPPVQCMLGDVASGAEVLVSLVVTPTQYDRGKMKNEAGVAATESDPNPGNNTARETTTIRPLSAALVIGMTDAPDPVRVGQPLTYTIQVSNTSADMAPSSRIVFEVPDQPTFISASTSQGSCGPPQTIRIYKTSRIITFVTCEVGTILFRQVVSATIIIAPGSVGPLQAVARALTSATPRPLISLPSARAVTMVRR